MDALKASIGIEFSLIGTQLHAMYEKSGNGYAILLIPSEQSPDRGISVKELIADIKKMASDVSGGDVDTAQLETAMASAAADGGKADDGKAGDGKDDDGKTGGAKSGKSMKLDQIMIQLQMAFLYIRKEGEESELEYAFQLQVLTEGLVPEAIKSIVDVTRLSVSVWNTDRRKVVDKMALITVDEYLGQTKALTDKKAV